MRSGALSRLVEAMDAADAKHLTVPCKAEPGLWTTDQVTFGSVGGRRRAAQAAAGCHHCPVIDECRAYMDDRNANPATQLYGVVAAQVTQDGHSHYVNINPARRSA